MTLECAQPSDPRVTCPSRSRPRSSPPATAAALLRTAGSAVAAHHGRASCYRDDSILVKLLVESLTADAQLGRGAEAVVAVLLECLRDSHQLGLFLGHRQARRRCCGGKSRPAEPRLRERGPADG